MARVLVIGGTLFIGRALVEMLLERGDEVVIMHRGSGTPFGDRVGEIRCDRNDVAAVQEALSGDDFDIVYDNVYDWERGTTGEQVAAAARASSAGLQRYVFMSSVAVYPPGGEYDESAPLVPSDFPNPYAAQKADSERALLGLHRSRGVPITTLRPAFVYGPHNPFDREAFFWDRILADRPLIVPEDGSNTMQWVHSREVALAAVRAAEAPEADGRAYNLGSYPALTHSEFVAMLGRVAGREPRVVHVPRARIVEAGGELFRPPFYFGVYLDIPAITVLPDRARSELGVEIAPLEDGMRETFEWYRRQDRPQPDFSWEDRLLSSSPQAVGD